MEFDFIDIIGACFVAGMIAMPLLTHRFLANAKQTMGTIIEIGGDDEDPFYSVEFKDPLGKTHTGHSGVVSEKTLRKWYKEFVPTSNLSFMQKLFQNDRKRYAALHKVMLGKQIPILYRKDRPSHIKLDTPQALWRMSWFSCILGIGIVVYYCIP